MPGSIFTASRALFIVWMSLLVVALGACSIGSTEGINEDGGYDPWMPDPDPPVEEEEGESDDGIDHDAEGIEKDDAALEDGGDAEPPSDASDPPDDTPEPPIEEPPTDGGAVEPPTEDAGGAVDAGMDGSGPPLSAPPRPARVQVVFSRRPTDNGPDTAIEDAMAGLVRRAVPGSRVRVAMYTFTRYRMAAELMNAARRGVDVRIVLDGHMTTAAGTEAPRLIARLGSDRVTTCGAPGTSCVGTGIQHNKFIVFSQLDDGSLNVTAVASHNFTGAQLHKHNNLVIVRDDLGLARAYERDWETMRRDMRVSNFYHFEDGDHDGTRAYFFPRSDGGDTIVSVLENVQCDTRSRVRVAMAFFTNARIAVAQALAALRRDGCSVSVVIGDSGIRAGSRVLSTLRAAGVRVTLYPERSGLWTMHSKYLLIDAPYSGSAGRRALVFTGSHNYTAGALTANDENLLRVENPSVFNAFLADWVRVRDAASRR